ncbi:MAG: hypothetical protein JWQ25_1818, partial [Daejeonella sp.]|nr:hypothetical protein [Daejeonella sp.]
QEDKNVNKTAVSSIVKFDILIKAIDGWNQTLWIITVP